MQLLRFRIEKSCICFSLNRKLQILINVKSNWLTVNFSVIGYFLFINGTVIALTIPSILDCSSGNLVRYLKKKKQHTELLKLSVKHTICLLVFLKYAMSVISI